MRLFALFFLAVLLFVPLGCATAPPPADVITVEGRVNQRGNEPFSALMLVTPTRNQYVLTFAEGAARTFAPSGTYRVTGRLYLDSWNSRPLAHLRVLDVEPMN